MHHWDVVEEQDLEVMEELEQKIQMVTDLYLVNLIILQLKQITLSLVLVEIMELKMEQVILEELL